MCEPPPRGPLRAVLAPATLSPHTRTVTDTTTGRSVRRVGLLALLAGAAGISFAPIWVRLSEVGPSATAFYRVALALPVLWLWLGIENRGPVRHPKPSTTAHFRLLAAAGAFFAGDLVVWHWSIKLTSVANATLLANFAPIFVALGARVWFGERIKPMFVVGMSLALCGAVLVAGASFSRTPGRLLGDLLGLSTALFYAGYILCTKQLRGTFSTAVTLAWPGLVTAPLLLAAGWLSGEGLQPASARGWAVLIALALTGQVAGQGLITYASAHLPASFLSVALVFQPAMAAVLAWGLLGERMTLFQGLGGVVVLTGICLASKARSPSPQKQSPDLAN